MRRIHQSRAVRQMVLIALLTLVAALGWSQATWAIEPRLQTVPTRAATGSATAVSSGTPGTGATATPLFGGTPSTGAIATATALAMITPTMEPPTPTIEASSPTPATGAASQPTPDGGPSPGSLQTVGIAALVFALLIVIGTVGAMVWRIRSRPS